MNLSKCFPSRRAVQQINGREGETATFLLGLSVTFSLREGGFAPRHLSRCAASLIAPLDEISDDC